MGMKDYQYWQPAPLPITPKVTDRFWELMKYGVWDGKTYKRFEDM